MPLPECRVFSALFAPLGAPEIAPLGETGAGAGSFTVRPLLVCAR